MTRLFEGVLPLFVSILFYRRYFDGFKRGLLNIFTLLVVRIRIRIIRIRILVQMPVLKRNIHPSNHT